MLRIIFILSFFLISCKSIENNNEVDYYNEIQTKLILAKSGDVVILPKGFISLKRSLWIDGLENIIITGHGIDNTILSFKDQIEGSEGIKVINSKNIILKNFTIEDSKGDLIKVENTSEINFINLKAQWKGKPKEENGAYALYPVNCNKVLIDNCIAIGASDAGIYVGQSKMITVRNSEAYNNVAGIEIENSYYADVYNNYTHNNSGGILVFDLPDLTIKSGNSVRVFNNIIVDNNHRNFAPKGNVVASVPSGTGIMVLATANVEIYKNKIYNNKTANTCIVSYYILDEPITDEEYYPYPSMVYIHDNIYKRDKMLPSLSFKQPIGFLLAKNYFNQIPDIIIDGIVDEKNKASFKNNPQNICIQNNSNATFLNLDASNNFKNMSTDIGEYDCSIPVINHTVYP